MSVINQRGNSVICRRRIGKRVTEVKKKLMRRYNFELCLAGDLGNLPLGSQPLWFSWASQVCCCLQVDSSSVVGGLRDT